MTAADIIYRIPYNVKTCYLYETSLNTSVTLIKTEPSELMKNVLE